MRIIFFGEYMDATYVNTGRNLADVGTVPMCKPNYHGIKFMPPAAPMKYAFLDASHNFALYWKPNPPNQHSFNPETPLLPPAVPIIQSLSPFKEYYTNEIPNMYPDIYCKRPIIIPFSSSDPRCPGAQFSNSFAIPLAIDSVKISTFETNVAKKMFHYSQRPTLEFNSVEHLLGRASLDDHCDVLIWNLLQYHKQIHFVKGELTIQELTTTVSSAACIEQGQPLGTDIYQPIIRNDWDNVKIPIMFYALVFKFWIFYYILIW